MRRILTDDGGAVAGVETDAGERVPLAAVVSNCDSVRTHRELLAGQPAARRFERRRRYEPACSGVVLYLGLDRAYDHLLHHNFVFSRDPDEEFDVDLPPGRAGPRPDLLRLRARPHRAGRRPARRRGALRARPHPLPAAAPRLERMLPAYRDVILDKLARTAGHGGHRGADRLRVAR